MYLISLSHDNIICIVLSLGLIIAFIIICLIFYVFIVNTTQLHHLWFNSSVWLKSSIISHVLLKRYYLELSDFWPSEQIFLRVWFTAMTTWHLSLECPWNPPHLLCLLPTILSVFSFFPFLVCLLIFLLLTLCIFLKAMVPWK